MAEESLTERRRFSCAECIRRNSNEVFQSLGDLERHINSTHEEGAFFECQRCPFASPDAAEACHHLASAHPDATPGQIHLCVGSKQALCLSENILLCSIALACGKLAPTKRDSRPRSANLNFREFYSALQTKVWLENRCRICQSVVWRRDEHIYQKHIGRFPFECTNCKFKAMEPDKAGNGWRGHCRLGVVLDFSQVLRQSGLLERFRAVCWPGDSARADSCLADDLRQAQLLMKAGRAALLRPSKADLPTASSHGVRMLQAGGSQSAQSKAFPMSPRLHEGFRWGDLGQISPAPLVDGETLADYVCKRCPYKHTLWRDRVLHISNTHLKVYPYKCSECDRRAHGFNTLRGARQHCYKVHDGEGAASVIDNSADVAAQVRAVFGTYFSDQRRPHSDGLKVEPVDASVAAESKAAPAAESSLNPLASDGLFSSKPDVKRISIDFLQNGDGQPQPTDNQQRVLPVDLPRMRRTRVVTLHVSSRFQTVETSPADVKPEK